MKISNQLIILFTLFSATLGQKKSEILVNLCLKKKLEYLQISREIPTMGLFLRKRSKAYFEVWTKNNFYGQGK